MFWWFVEISRGGGSAQSPACQCVAVQLWAYNGALQGQIQPLMMRAAGLVAPALVGAAAELGGWFVGLAVLPVCGAVQRRRQRWATTTAHRALPVCEWPAMGIPLGTTRSNAASDVCSRCGWLCAGGCGRAGQVVCEEGCGFAGFWRVPEEESALANHSAQSPASV